jgi:AcrR family transcriptional regulator
MGRRAATAVSPRKKPSQERAQATVEAILAATAHILIAHGFEGLSTNKVAARAGVSIGSLYQYFPSKEALVAALGARHHDELMSVLGGALVNVDVDEDDPAGSIAAVVASTVGAMLDAHAVDPALHRVLSEEIPRRVVHQHLEQSAMLLVRGLLEAHRRHLAVDDVDAATFLLVSLVESASHNAVLERPDLLRGPLRQELTAMITRYLLPPSSFANGRRVRTS